MGNSLTTHGNEKKSWPLPGGSVLGSSIGVVIPIFFNVYFRTGQMSTDTEDTGNQGSYYGKERHKHETDGGEAEL